MRFNASDEAWATQSPTPIVTSRYDLHALRRTPPTDITPFADGPPVIRIIYAYCRRSTGETVAVILFGGDKATLANRWYPPSLVEAERRLLVFSGKYDLTPIRRKNFTNH
jgi:hypothetical protein